MSIEIVVGGDIVPTFKNIEYFQNPSEHVLMSQECKDLLNCVDFRIYNLETPITDNFSPIDKDGANFAAASTSIRGIKALQSDLITVANNHCKDHGPVGLKNTIDILIRESILPIGYGFSHKVSNDVGVLEKDGVKVSVIACAEKEFNIFENDEIGAVPYHDYWTNKKIAKAKKCSDAVIVLYHGGNEYFTYIPRYLRERCHLMAENGADYIFCQHSHCIGCYEKYVDTTIVYGQGNFIFHQRNNRPMTKEGLLVKLCIDKNDNHIEYIPVVLNDQDQVCIADDLKREEILGNFEIRSQYVKDESNINLKYSKFADERHNAYIARIRGGNPIYRLFIKILSKLKITQYRKQDYINILNILQNESHRELFITSLKKKINDMEEDDI